jgi:hypothetical protein
MLRASATKQMRSSIAIILISILTISVNKAKEPFLVMRFLITLIDQMLSRLLERSPLLHSVQPKHLDFSASLVIVMSPFLPSLFKETNNLPRSTQLPPSTLQASIQWSPHSPLGGRRRRHLRLVWWFRRCKQNSVSPIQEIPEQEAGEAYYEGGCGWRVQECWAFELDEGL